MHTYIVEEQISAMRLFSIKELERLCGVSAHVIRTWEKRFDILSPERLANNVRQYTINDVKRLADIAMLLSNGYRISRIAGMSAEEIADRLLLLKAAEERQKQVVNRLVQHMFCCDTEQFEAELDNATLSWGIDTVIGCVILPFLEKTDLFSYNDTNIETHFVVTALRRKLILGIEKTQPVVMNGLTALLYLPEDEHYDLVLLYLEYILRRQGYRTFYLGTNISITNLDVALHIKSPDRLYTYMSNKKGMPLKQYTNILRNKFPHLSLRVIYADKKMTEAIDDPCVRFYKYNLL